MLFLRTPLSLSAQAPVRPAEPALLNRDESRSVSPQSLQNFAIGTSSASRTCSGSVRNKIRLLYTFASSVPAKVCCMFSSRWCLHIPAVSEILLRRAVRKTRLVLIWDRGEWARLEEISSLSQVKYPHPFPPPPSAPWVCVRTQLTKNPQSDWQQNTHTHTQWDPPPKTHTSHHNSSRFITGCYRTATRKHTFDIFHILHIPWHLPTYYERLHRLA